MSDNLYAPPEREPTLPRASVATLVGVLFAALSLFLCVGMSGWAMYRVTNEPTSSDEEMAIGKLMSLEIAQGMYRDTDRDGDGVKAYGTLKDLARTRIIDRVLGSGTFRGYRYTCTPSPIDSSTRWLATAAPLPGSSYTTHFAVNQDGEILVLNGKPFPTDPDAPLPTDARPLDW